MQVHTVYDRPEGALEKSVWKKSIPHTSPLTTHNLLALGLLDDSVAVEPLLDFLGEPAAAASAARALHPITGRDLWEEVFVVEQVEEEDLLEDERAAFRSGASATNPNGELAGEYLVHLSQNPETWRAWWQAHSRRFQEGMRFRNGLSFTPACLLENLRAEKSPNPSRLLAHLEFQIRYGFSVPFELEMPISQQKQAIEAYASWVEANQPHFEPSQWYFAGRRV